ncbi:hypothetical protein [Glutamicibacter arilaitensis]|uniref:antitoxin VbhA family protein n=1 Tax=Glutamicibacter arilaitensis TaxID=256701 RepID=UPI00384E1290
MSKILDLQLWWPELFEGLDSRIRNAIVQVLASSWHEGWEANREDVENFTDFICGEYDREEYLRRAVAIVSDS